MYSALGATGPWSPALMKSADQPPIKASRLLALGTGRGMSVPSSTGSPSRHNHPRKGYDLTAYAVAVAGISFWNRRLLRRTAQMMRAVLLAIATAATLAGRRSNTHVSQLAFGDLPRA